MQRLLLPLIARREIAEGTMAFWFDASGPGFSFAAGQYVLLANPDLPEPDPEGNDRTFSIASSPADPGKIMIATRLRPTPFKRALKTLPLGAKLPVAGPMGSFTLHQDATKPAVFLAGGIGITPFRSMVEYATQTKTKHRITLFYSNKTAKQAAFLEDFAAWKKANKHFTFVPTITEPDGSPWKYETGRISADMIAKHVPDLSAPVFYIAGPPAMVAALRETLVAAGVPGDSIRTEDFTGY